MKLKSGDHSFLFEVSHMIFKTHKNLNYSGYKHANLTDFLPRLSHERSDITKIYLFDLFASALRASANKIKQVYFIIIVNNNNNNNNKYL